MAAVNLYGAVGAFFIILNEDKLKVIRGALIAWRVLLTIAADGGLENPQNTIEFLTKQERSKLKDATHWSILFSNAIGILIYHVLAFPLAFLKSASQITWPLTLRRLKKELKTSAQELEQAKRMATEALLAAGKNPDVDPSDN